MDEADEFWGMGDVYKRSDWQKDMAGPVFYLLFRSSLESVRVMLH